MFDARYLRLTGGALSAWVVRSAGVFGWGSIVTSLPREEIAPLSKATSGKSLSRQELSRAEEQKDDHAIRCQDQRVVEAEIVSGSSGKRTAREAGERSGRGR